MIRDRRGKSRGEPLRVANEVIAVRERLLVFDGIQPEHALDALAGFTLGRLLLRHRADPMNPGSISQKQYDAGDAWCKLVHRHASIMGYNLTTPRSLFTLVGAMGGGRGVGPELDPEVIGFVRRQWRECYGAIMKAGNHGEPVWRITYGVAVENWPVGRLSPLDFGSLRTGLNALARVLN